jgi:SAM-dependent methyltransferase
MACGVVFSARGSTGRVLLEAMQRYPEREPARVMIGRSWLRVRCLELSGMRVTFRRYLRNATLGWLLTGRTVGGFCRRYSGNRLVKPFWGAGQWRLYMQHRFTTPSFLAARTALGLLQPRDGLILDAPCGMGHFSHYLAKMTDPARIVAMDLDPKSAYAARRFFIPNAAAVLVWDMNEPLPLEDESAGAIFCIDAFHYVTEKRALAREFTRVLRRDGVIAILHLHNRLQKNPTPGTPLSPDEYADLFLGNTVRMYPEDHFLNAQLRNEPIDLTRSAPPEDLEKANALMLIVAKDADTLTALAPTRTLLAAQASNPQLSDLYAAHSRGEKVIFERSIPPTLHEEYPNMDTILPPRVSAAAPVAGAQTPPADQQNLLERNVFIDLPENY